MDKNSLDKSEGQFINTDELLTELDEMIHIGRAAMAAAGTSTAPAEINPADRYDTMKIKIGNISAGLLPYFSGF